MCLEASRVHQHISALPVAAVTSVPTQQALPPRTVPCVAPLWLCPGHFGFSFYTSPMSGC